MDMHSTHGFSNWNDKADVHETHQILRGVIYAKCFATWSVSPFKQFSSRNMYYHHDRANSFSSARPSWNVWISSSLTDRLWRCGELPRAITGPQPVKITGRLILQNLVLQVQVKLASLGWCHKSRYCASFLCAYINVFLQSERWRCQYWSAYVAGAIMWLRYGSRKVCETRAESCQVIWLGLCGCNTAILCVGLHESCDVLHVR
jgi:hypothetical protein